MIAMPAFASSVAWNLPTTYTDDTAIPTASQARITVRLFNGSTSALCLSASVPFASSTAGSTLWTGTLPVVTRGATSYYCATALLDGMESVKSPTVVYTVPFVAPKAPGVITIQF